MTSPESEVRTLLDSRSEAAWNKDLDRLMSLYSPDIVYFDIVPPLRYAGSAALRDRFADWFERWQSPIGQQLHDPSIVAGGDVAAAYMLIRASGTLTTGREVGYWVRVSNSFRRSDRGWLITHEHVSLPVDFQSGTPCTSGTGSPSRRTGWRSSSGRTASGSRFRARVYRLVPSQLPSEGEILW